MIAARKVCEMRLWFCLVDIDGGALDKVLERLEELLTFRIASAT